MKRIYFLMIACAVLLCTSCGNNKKAVAEEQEKSFEQQQIEANIKAQLDSIGNIWCTMKGYPVITKGKIATIELSESERMLKPTYLLDPAIANDLVTLSQKYRAIAMLRVDQVIAGLYEMPEDDFKSATAKLAIDLNDNVFKDLADRINENPEEAINEYYKGAAENGRINFFWETTAAALVEQLYILSQNIDKFAVLFDDETASNMTYRIVLLKMSIDDLASYSPEIQTLSEVLKPLEVLNAIDLQQFKNQLVEMKGQLEVVRGELLK